MNLAELQLEYLADLYRRQAQIQEELVDAKGPEVGRLLKDLAVIQRVLQTEEDQADAGPVYTGDPVADEWERALAEGREPDWDLGAR